MTNVNDLSGPANATYHTACAGIVPSDIIWSAATHRHLMHCERPVTGLSFEHCHRDIVSHQLRPPCVWRTGENMNESPTSLPHSSAPTCCFFHISLTVWVKGSWVFCGWLAETPGSDSHWASEWAGTVSPHLRQRAKAHLSSHKATFTPEKATF